MNAWDPSGHKKNYIFFSSLTKAGDGIHYTVQEAKIQQKKYGEKKTILIPINNAKEFKRKWDMLPNKEIGLVYFIFHGSIDGEKGSATGYMYHITRLNTMTRILSRKASFMDEKTDIDVPSLKRKKIRKMIFSCCNSANPDCYNIADAFIKKAKGIKSVLGFDGGSLFNYESNKLEKGKGNQITWNKYVPTVVLHKRFLFFSYDWEEPTRKRMGKRKYENGKWAQPEQIEYKTRHRGREM